MLPAAIATIMPVFAKKIFKDRLSTPIDFNKAYKGKPIFGRNKTYRGFAFGVMAAVLAAYAQKKFYSFQIIKSISLVDYATINIFLWGFLMGFGALAGDLIKSFFKRRIGIEPGRPWLFFDQADFIIGSLLFTSPIYLPDLKILSAIIGTGPFIALIVSRASHWLKIRENP